MQCLLCKSTLQFRKERGYGNTVRHYRNNHSQHSEQFKGIQLFQLLKRKLFNSANPGDKQALIELLFSATDSGNACGSTCLGFNDSSPPTELAEFNLSTSLSTSSQNASYAVSLELARDKCYIVDGERIKKCSILMAEYCNENKAADKFKNVSLSRHFVIRRIGDIAEYQKQKLKHLLHVCTFFQFV